ncbi:MAG: hypothetical protein M1828_006638 [Chrysothrix sp. TS-e1954]|nr:MAG: hypothetical protein M1828_006638 [Chrysothrix sp. TS-e1954]
MSDSVDRVFVHALNTVKKIPRVGSSRPPPADRLRLYALYKQGMEGDVDGVMKRPKGSTAEVRSDQEKWDAWNHQKGLTRTEAKRQYITTLIDTMHRYASNTPDAHELVSELEFVWDQIKSNPPSSSSSNSYPLQQTHSGNSPISVNDQPIYPVMSEQGARNPRGKPLRLLSPVSQREEDITEAEQENTEEEPEEFVDAQDSRNEDSASEEYEAVKPVVEPPKKSTGGIMAPITRYMAGRKGQDKPKEDPIVLWQRRIESALIKMNAEMAALREQLEMQQGSALSSSILRPFRRRRQGGVLGWLLDSLFSISSFAVKHLVMDALLLMLVALYMRFRGIPTERFEQFIVRCIRKIQRLAFWRRLSQTYEKSNVKLPVNLSRSLASNTGYRGAGG